MPFGISPAPEIFQKAMHDIFEGIPVEIIADDLCVSGRSIEEHDKNVASVLERARQVKTVLLTCRRCREK